MLTRLLITVILSAGVLLAQEFRATLQGTVTDPSQATIAGAEVVLRNVDTSVERKTVTTNEGHYLWHGPHNTTFLRTPDGTQRIR